MDKLTPDEKLKHRQNWLAPAGSPKEKRILKRLAGAKHLTDEDRLKVMEWLAQPDSSDKRMDMWWKQAKKRFLGDFVNDAAMERQKSLNSEQWHVAYLTTAGYNQQREIPDMLGVDRSTVNRRVREIKAKIQLDYDQNEEVTTLEIVGWFLGL